MPEFLELIPPNRALESLLSLLSLELNIEEIDTSESSGRITAEPIIAEFPLPSFNRSTVDGFAVRAEDTFGASDSLPAYLQIVQEVPMGKDAAFSLRRGETALIHTGGMLPADANAVVMTENTQSARPGMVEILRAAAVGENTLKAGEDVAVGEVAIPAGARLRAVEIGGLMALGITRVRVICRPRVGIISSGDEVIPPEDKLEPGQVRDVNSYALSALIKEIGGEPIRFGIASDQFEMLREMSVKALDSCDMVVITAGSSASARDLTSLVIQSLGRPGVLVHGVNIKPGKPTILAICDGKPVIGLPGNPVSAFVIGRYFIRPVLERMQGFKGNTFRPNLPARLSINLASQAGREDWIPVRIHIASEGYQAEPVFGKSNLIFSLVRADGLIRIPPDATGLSAGDLVEVELL